jgi:hypothetical protein
LEPAAAREREDRLDNIAACGFDLGQRAFEVIAAEDGGSASDVRARRQFRSVKAAIQSLTGERGTIEAGIHQSPAERQSKETLRGRQFA